MIMTFTCKDCGNRHPGCHSQCEKYQKEKAAYEKQKAENVKHNSIQGGLDAQRNNAVRKALRRRVNKWGRDNQ